MEMTYEKFIKIVPKETAEFTSQVIPYFYHYFDHKAYIKIANENYNKDFKLFLIILYTLSQNENYKHILARCGLDFSELPELKPEEFQSNEKNTFERNASYFLIYDDESFYFGLTPLDLLIESANKIKGSLENTYNTGNYYYYINRMFPKRFKAFLNSLNKTRESQFDEMINNIKENMFEKLPIDTIDYLETASKIRTIIYKKLRPNNEIVTRSDDDIVPLSLFLAILFPDKSLPNESDLNLIGQILKNEGVTLEKIFRSLNFSFTYDDLDKTSPNFFILEDEYQKYFKKDKDMTTIDVVKKIFDRDTTKSLAVEKLLLSLGKQIETFSDIEDYLKKQANQLEKNILANFYKDLPKASKDYIEFVGKAYTFLREKLKDNSSEIIVNDNDIIVLAFYLASVNFQTELNSFFTYKGVTYEKVMQLLNLNINLKDIENSELDYKVLTNKIKKYVFQGRNERRNSENISISLIERNIYDGNFTSSKLLHHIFEEITTEPLESDFSNQIKEAEKESEKVKQEEFFKGFPINTIYFLEQVSAINQAKELKINNLNDRTIIVLILSALTKENEMKDFFTYLGFSVNEIKKYLGIQTITYDEGNIDNLIRDYSKIIFEGNNKGKQKSNITIYDIAKNIFSKDLNNSVFINKFFDHFNLSNDIYDNFDQLYQEYQNEHQKNVNKKLLYDKRNNIDTKEEKFLIFTIKVHKKLLEYNIDSNNIKNIAIILYLLYYENPLLPFLNKNGLTLEKVFTYLNLPQDFLDDLNEIEIDSDIFANYYQNLTTNEIKKIFIGKDEDIAFMKEMAEKLGIDFKILQTEIKTEQDYEFSLSVNERIKLLDEKPVDSLDVDDIQSVIKFGDSLGFHSQYIYDELPKLMLSDANDESIASINDTLNKVYSHKKEEKPKGLFERLFAFEVEEETTEIVLDPIAIEELKEKISKNIKKLSEELLNYDTIRKYIEVYRRKNNFYLSRILNVAEALQKEVEGLNPNKEEEYADFLSVGSNLQIIKNKINRFKTSSHLMQQELVKVNQAIINHFITINALEMARDDLLPLINAELAIGKGRNTENQSLQITQNVFDLFQSLLTRNAEAAEQNMQLLQKSTLSNEIISVLSQDIETYLNGLNQARQISMTDDLLSIDNEKQKVLKKESNN